MTFEEYKDNHHRTIRIVSLSLCWLSCVLCLSVELGIFYLSNSKGLIDWSIKKYIITKIVIPSTVNFCTTIICTLYNAKSKRPSHVKNHMAVMNVLVLCSVMAISHAYFSHIMFVLLFPLFLCVLYDSSRTLKIVSFSLIIPFILTCLEYWISCSEINDMTKIMNLVVFFLIFFISYLFSVFLLKIHQSQTNYIYNNYKKQEELINELRIEPMTRLFNRTSMEEWLEYAIVNSNRNKFAIAVVDIDFFKSVNDTFGHETGDIVLLNLANTFRKFSNDKIKAFRYGGEEFLILFEDFTLEAIIQWITTCKQEFIELNKSEIKDRVITFTCGISELKPSVSKCDWFKNADNALYKGKQEGRNKIIIGE